MDTPSDQPVYALQAKLLARQAKISQVRVGQTLDEILLNASSCGHNHVHLTHTHAAPPDELAWSSAALHTTYRRRALYHFVLRQVADTLPDPRADEVGGVAEEDGTAGQRLV